MTQLHAERPTLLLMGAAERAARGLEIERRRAELGMSKSALAKRAGMDRATLNRVIEGEDGVRTTSLVAAEKALEDMDDDVIGEPMEPRTVRFEVRNVYGAEALVVEGPVENIAELEAMVDRIMRRRGEDADER